MFASSWPTRCRKISVAGPARNTWTSTRRGCVAGVRLLNEQGGWSCPGWPRSAGGPGWNHEQQYIFESELALNDAPRIHQAGAQLIGPALLEYGNADQRSRFCPGTLNGDILWCQGYSEPNAGSDLASLKCRAEREGDEYVINGTKIWTTDGHFADWMFGLFGTDSGGKKQHGITLLLLPMSSPGIEVRPLITFDDTHEVNQVFFTDVRVPVRDRVGDEDQGLDGGEVHSRLRALRHL